MAMYFNKLILYISFSLLLTSCASILNSSNQKITIITSKPTEIIVDNSVSKKDTIHEIILERGKKNVDLTVRSDSMQKSLVLKPRISAKFFGNLLLPYGIYGFLFDLTNKRRYGYKRNIRVNMSDSTKQVIDPYKMDYLTLNSEYRLYKNSVKITPFSFVAFHGLPCFDAAYERKINENVAVQFSAGIFLNNEANPRFVGGFKVGLEPRIYFAEQFEGRFFAAFSWNYINMDFTKEMRYVFNDTTYSGIQKTPFRIHRDAVSFALKLGYQYFITPHFSLEAYVGVGSMVGYNLYYTSLPSNAYVLGDFNVPYLIQGNFFTPTFPCNIKLAYSF